jgi:hypothetical protein
MEAGGYCYIAIIGEGSEAPHSKPKDAFFVRIGYVLMGS